MKSKFLQAACLLVLLASGARAGAPDTRDARMAWWRQARFGMFVHWGLHSGLAGNWNGKPAGEHEGIFVPIKVQAAAWAYAKAAIPTFQPKPGVAAAWAKLAKAAGCGYVVLTTKHHDGFALHDSKFGGFHAGAVLKRDLLREFADACRAEGLRVGFYHSLIDWHHDQYEYNRTRVLPHPLRGMPYPNGTRDHAKYVDFLHAQVNELISNYGQVDVMWFDYSAPDFQGQEAWRAFDLIRSVSEKQPAIIINNRLFRTGEAGWNMATGKSGSTLGTRFGDFLTPEQYIPQDGMPAADWETCMTMNGTWGYNEHDNNWKSPETIIRKLVDIASKGGNFLLNIGPTGDGSIPQPSIDIMTAVGKWMDINAEAIRGTSASVFGAGSGNSSTGDGKESSASSSVEWRSTTKPGRLYLHVFRWPADGKFVLPGLLSKVTKAYLLADRRDLKVGQFSDVVTITLPVAAPDPIASVICLEIADTVARVAKETDEGIPDIHHPTTR